MFGISNSSSQPKIVSLAQIDILLPTSGYDKLKPYGFPVHGAIDGFSRRILWLEVVRSNNNPDVTANLFLESIKEVGGCPRVLISDRGTENGTAAAIQCTLRSGSNDPLAGMKAHRFCSSPANQRIEGWWSFLRRNRSGWWMDFFKSLVDDGTLLLGDRLHMECLWFCFARILQNDLNKVKDHWNSHRISKSGYGNAHGVPDIMYYLPEYYTSHDCVIEVEEDELHQFEEYTGEEDDENTYTEYFEYLIDQLHLDIPTEEHSALQMFQRIVSLQ